ncbi:hypothetical protein EMIT0111MI5_180015 [Burkholderia sp. IT-111MI5]
MRYPVTGAETDGHKLDDFNVYPGGAARAWARREDSGVSGV